MKNELVASYKKRLLIFFRETRTHSKSKEFGVHKAMIHLTLPFMVLENWREDGHTNDIPLLDEAVKNLVLATTTVIFGWKKTCCLHLRVTLESVFTGIALFISKKAFSKFTATGIIPYRKFSSILKDFSDHSTITRNICSAFPVLAEVRSLYDALSKWSHSLGTPFVSDLSILGFSKLDAASIGQFRSYYNQLSKYSVISFLSINPKILHDISASNQRLLMQPLTIDERKKLREIIGM